MTEHELRAQLREVRIPDEALSQERTWAVVRGAHRSAEIRAPRQRWRATVPAVGALAAVAILALAIGSAPRQAVARWVRDALGLSALPHARPSLGPLPGGGQVLVSASSGVWLVTPRGGRRHLGSGEGASFSPHSLYVAVWRGHELAALDLRGRRQWSVTSSSSVSGARWSPDGYRIAYLAGRSLMVVAGDGGGAHALVGHVSSVAPAWQPRTGVLHRVTFLNRGGAIELRDADSGALIWTVHPSTRPEQLLWSTDGRRLVVLSRRQVALYSSAGRRLASRTLGGGGILAGGAVAAGGRLALVIARAAPVTSLELVTATPGGLRLAPRGLLTAAERLVGISWSPDHRWLLVVGPSADQWLFVRATGAPRIIAVSRIAAAFGAPGRRRAATDILGALFPRVAGWQALNPLARGS